MVPISNRLQPTASKIVRAIESFNVIDTTTRARLLEEVLDISGEEKGEEEKTPAKVERERSSSASRSTRKKSRKEESGSSAEEEEPQEEDTRETPPKRRKPGSGLSALTSKLAKT